MVGVQASKLKLPIPSIASFPPQTTSVLFEPQSLSLALMHSDSSFSLYPSFSPLSLSSLPPPQTLIPPPSSSSTFLLLQNSNSDPDPRTVFVVSGPQRGGPQVLLRFYVLLRKSNFFARVPVVCNQRALRSDEKLGVLVDVNHGVSVRLSGSVNFFAMYTVSSAKILVFAVRLLDGDGGEDDVRLKLMNCAVIECSKPVFSISVSFESLILGEQSGVRVFSLRHLVKGRIKNGNGFSSNSANGKLDSRGFHLPNGVIGGHYVKHGAGRNGGGGASEVTPNGYLDGRVDKHYGPVKQSYIKFRQDSREGGACFVAFKSGEVESSTCTRKLQTSVKAISIQALSPKTFVILDSAGELHLLHLSTSVIGSESSCHMKQLPHIMTVQKLVVFPDVSIRTQTVWISDGSYSVHMMAVSDTDAAVNDNDKNEGGDKLMQISVSQAIFTSEKIEDVISLAPNAVLVLGQGCLKYKFNKQCQKKYEPGVLLMSKRAQKKARNALKTLPKMLEKVTSQNH